MPEGEEEEQEIENLVEKIMENVPNLAKEIDFQEVQKAQSPKEVGLKEAHTKHIIIKLPKITVERILTEAREETYLQRCTHKTLS